MLITGIVGTSLAVPASAMADDPPPTSAVDVSSTTLNPGDTLTVTQTVYNKIAIPIEGGKAALYAEGADLTGSLDLVGCTGATICYAYNGQHFRADVGDVPPGESRTVVWTLRVKDSPVPGPFVLRHQFLGDNYAFDAYTGPTITITPQAADVAVALTASVRSTLTARITYTVTIKNNGPGDASGIRVVATYPTGLVYAGSTCTRVGTTRSVNCDVPSLAAGASTTRTLTADSTLLTVGSLTATAQRTASSPSDPVPANDKATRTCTALTGLIVHC
ncbi:putative repeat protein (TIGR01451 family) [Kribbella aluminosa]|uniref:Repeat protein (TIGR01451 family) n=1 Tax=Kribbella aluminosa TaxID=416017 RepID=A0ABS4UU13_9ACTN|nr:DUF11 domain-containing protein [Kribbella aluminosa]MBP2355046.1 putative repeat protein (TIGR01451 family) [Kribbella aluminosa]